MEIKVAHKSITKEILNDESTSQTVTMFVIPANSYVLHLVGRVRTVFAGVTTPTVSVGISTGTSDLMKAQRIDIIGDLLSGMGMDDKSLCPRQNMNYVNTEAEKLILATFTSSSGNFSSVSAGNVEFVLVYLA